MTMPGQTQPFLYPGMYNPGQFAFGNNAELSQLISMFAMPLLGQMAGPGNFMPHMMPGQALFDQFTMRNYQQQQQAATYALAGAQNSTLAQGLLGARSMFTNAPASDLNRSQAEFGAGLLNNPMVKSIMGMALGPENVEALLHGSKGDIQTLGSTINRIGYFRRDPSGGGRMDAESLEDLTTGVFSHLYEPQGNTEKLAKEARKGNQRSLQRLQEAARMEDLTVVEDTDIERRLLKKGDSEVEALYKKYVQGGTATDATTQAKELTKFDRAIKESGVLHGTEASVGMLQTRADRVPVDEMHGFMAGQVGQLTENLFQRGVLPPSIGGLSGAGRVGAIAETKLDDATLDRMAQKLAQREVEKSDTDAGRLYREATTDAERSKVLANVAEQKKTDIQKTKDAADAYASGDRTRSAEDILQATGGEALASNVDASRSASKLKEYTEALSAVRDIFGDNGNPNAPMPALMAVLDQLTQGGMGQMKPAQVATTLRQMQTLARETGTGMQQLGTMSMVAGNMGQQLGLAPSITMQNVAASMGITKAAMDSGAFSSGVFGGLSKEQFQLENIKDMQTSAASGNAKALAALNYIYKTDPKKFAGKELEAAMAAYNDPNSDGTYTFKDTSGKEVTKNLYDIVGRGRQFGAQAILTNSGGNASDFYARVNSPQAQQYAQADKAYLTLKHQTIQRLNMFSTRASVRHAMRDSDVFKGMSANQKTHYFNEAGKVLTGMAIDTAAEMNPEDQITYLQNNMKDKLKEHFIAQKMPEPEAERMAAEMSQKMGGDRLTLGRMLGNLDTYAASFGMGTMTVLGQKMGRNRDTQGILEGGVARHRAEAQKRMLGYESTLGQRASDYFLDIGKRGENFNLDQFLTHMAPAIGDKQVLQAFAGRMGAGMHSLAAAKEQYQITDKDVEQLTAQAAKGGAVGAAAEEKLRAMGKISKDTEIIYQSEIDAAKKEKLSGRDKMSDEKVEEVYAKVTGGSGAHRTADAKREFLLTDEKYATQFEQEYVSSKRAGKGNKKYVTEKGLMSAAMRAVGDAKDGADKNELARLNDMQRALERGQDTSALKAGIDSFFDSKTFAEGNKGVDKKKLRELMTGAGNSQKEILALYDLSEEDFKRGQSLAFKDKTAKQRAVEQAVAVDAAKEIHADKLGGEAAAAAGDAKQKVDKANIDAATVVINAGKVEGGGGAVADSALAKTDLAPLNKEMNDIEKRKKKGYLRDTFASPEDEKRWKELNEKKGQVILAEQAAVSAIPDASAADTASTHHGRYGSANINPASLNSPQQAAGTISVAGSAAGGAGDNTMTLNGKLRVEGLYEAVIAATTQKAIHPPGRGPTVVADTATAGVRST